MREVGYASTGEGQAPSEPGATRASEPRPLPSRVADRYSLLRSLGSGGMGEVFCAHDERSGERVALKVVRRGDAVPRGVARLLREAVVAGRVLHPSVVRVFDAGEDEANDLAYVSQELLHGETLRERLSRRGRLSPSESVAVLLPVVDALAAAHEAGVVHRDLKPENIFLEGDDDAPRPRVIDFGIARLVASYDASNTQLTATGSVLGTPAYMSPEQARGADDIDEQTDVWAAGVVLYEMLTGAIPFARATPHATLAAILLDAVTPPHEVAPEVPEALSAVALRALCRNRVERFGSMRELHDALVAATAPGARPTSPALAAERSRRPRRAFAVGAVAAVASIAVAVPLLRPRSAPHPPVTQLAPSRAPAPATPPPPATPAPLATPATARPIADEAQRSPEVAPVHAAVTPRPAPTRRVERSTRVAAQAQVDAGALAPTARRTNGAPILGL
ncbi:MAG: serine/threonine-protein kinase [Polyangiales bacterium]